MSVDRGKTSTGMQANVEALLCYLGGWITGLIFVLIEKENSFVRFHAWQSIIVSVAMVVLSFIPLVNLFIWVIGFILLIFLMFKAYQGQMFKLPVIGDFAEKQAKV
jgi:uncharacterized membrane protein